MRMAPSTSPWRKAVALLQAAVQHVEREAGAGERLGAAAQGHLVAARHRIDAETLLDEREVLVELAEQFLDQAIVVEGNDNVAKVGGRRATGAGIVGRAVKKRPPSAVRRRSEPNRLLVDVLSMRTRPMVPISS